MKQGTEKGGRPGERYWFRNTHLVFLCVCFLRIINSFNPNWNLKYGGRTRSWDMPNNKISEHSVYWKELFSRFFMAYVYLHLMVLDKLLGF